MRTVLWRRFRIDYTNSNRIAGFRQGKEFSHGLGQKQKLDARRTDPALGAAPQQALEVDLPARRFQGHEEGGASEDPPNQEFAQMDYPVIFHASPRRSWALVNFLLNVE